MKFKELKQEVKKLQEKLNGANKVIYAQMQEIQEQKELILKLYRMLK